MHAAVQQYMCSFELLVAFFMHGLSARVSPFHALAKGSPPQLLRRHGRNSIAMHAEQARRFAQLALKPVVLIAFPRRCRAAAA